MLTLAIRWYIVWSSVAFAKLVIAIFLIQNYEMSICEISSKVFQIVKFFLLYFQNSKSFEFISFFTSFLLYVARLLKDFEVSTLPSARLYVCLLAHSRSQFWS